MAFKLTLANVKEACRKAYANHTLLAQNSPHLPYGYEVEGYHCAIGCALDRATLDRIKKENRQDSRIILLAKDMIEISPEEIDTINKIQLSHDGWKRRRGGDGAFHKEFLRLIQ